MLALPLPLIFMLPSSWIWEPALIGPGLTARVAHSNDNSNALALSGSSVYFTGHFAQNAAFGPISLTCSTIADLYVAKLLDVGASASFTWVQQANGPGYNEAKALVVTGTSVYVGGTMMQANSTLPSLVFGTTTLAANAVSEMFVAKLTDAGASARWVWACKSNNPSSGGFADLHGLLLSGTAVYATGLCAGSGPCFGTNPFSAYGGNIFVSRLTDQGSTVAFDWALRGGNSYVEAGNALALRAGLVYMVGYAAKSPILFGSIALTTTPSSDSQRGVVAAVSDSKVLATTPTLTTQFRTVVFPNPAHSKVQVLSIATERVLYNAQGATVRAFTPGLTTLDLSGLAPGIYYLQTGQQGTRLVVE
ncbi:MAG: T9SS type A sorting domain-containing protein [Hymenobacter sp.]|nr:MAG: T9SS type A sorting domain-containing protein [Hymenobacter sp.]